MSKTDTLEGESSSEIKSVGELEELRAFLKAEVETLLNHPNLSPEDKADLKDNFLVKNLLFKEDAAA